MGHVFHPSILREYDVRGVVGETLTEADAYAVGAAFGTKIIECDGAKVAVGRDGRLTSPALADAMADGLASCGLTVLRIGVGPTPMLYFAERHLPADAGVMITGSHNPPNYNGFKLCLGTKPFFGERVQELGRLAANGETATGAGTITNANVFDAYVAGLLAEATDIGAPTVGWDCGNGAAGDVIAAAVPKLAGTHHMINEAIDGTFPAHHPDPTVPENLVQLQSLVADKQCDFGIGFDGDGDRIGVIDSNGRIVWADQLMLIYARDLLSMIPGATILADVKSSQILFDGIAAAGGRPEMSPTGHAIIKTRMRERGAPMAGEMSGHICFADRYWGFDDALYCAMRLLRVVAASGKSLTTLVDELPRVVNTPELRFEVDEERKFDIVAEVKQRLANSDAEINDIDGVRVRDDDGWWLLRASNTQNVLVARCEAASEQGLADLKQQLVDQLVASGVAIPGELTN